MITDTEYRAFNEMMHGWLAVIQPIPIQEMIERANRSLAVGPVLDPTLWREKHKDVELDIEVFKAFRSVQQIAEKLAAGAKS